MSFFKRQKNLNTFILAFNAKFEGVQIIDITGHDEGNGEFFDFTLSALPDIIKLTQFCNEEQYELIRYRPRYNTIYIR